MRSGDVQHALHLLGAGDAGRLLHEYVQPGFQCGDGHLGVQVVRNGGDHRVHQAAGEQLLVVGEEGDTVTLGGLALVSSVSQIAVRVVCSAFDLDGEEADVEVALRGVESISTGCFISHVLLAQLSAG